MDDSNLMCNDYSNNKIISFLLTLKQILDRGYFSNYYRKDSLVSLIKDSSVFEFSYVSISEQSNRNVLDKEKVYEYFKSDNIQNTIELCFELYHCYLRNEIQQERLSDDLTTTTYDLIGAYVSFKRSKIIKMDLIEKLLSHFVEELIGSFTLIDEKCCRTTKPIMLIMLSTMFMEVETICTQIAEEITNILQIFCESMKKLKPSHVAGHHKEMLAMYLHIIKKCFEKFSVPKRIVEDKDFNIKNIEKKLFDILSEINDFVPDYLEKTITECIKLIN